MGFGKDKKCEKCGNTTFKVKEGETYIEFMCTKCDHEDVYDNL